jgi:putative nucleotidyltransferase with HDIG domain
MDQKTLAPTEESIVAQERPKHDTTGPPDTAPIRPEPEIGISESLETTWHGLPEEIDELAQHEAESPTLIGKLAKVNTHLWLILSVLVIAGIVNYLIAAESVILGLYYLPTLFAAYVYGKRHALVTAAGSITCVGLLASTNPGLFSSNISSDYLLRWPEIGAWGGMLMILGYTMGTLHDRHRKRVAELRETYEGLLMIFRQFISKDEYTDNHCHRVSLYATQLALVMGLRTHRIEEIRAAALLHDIGKMDVSRDLLYKAGKLTESERDEMDQHTRMGADMLSPVGASLGRIIPIILAHHERYDGSGKFAMSAGQIPLEARIIAVADVYDSLTSDRPYRKAMTAFEARDIIVRGSGSDFDPCIVKVFSEAFKSGMMELSVPSR